MTQRNRLAGETDSPAQQTSSALVCSATMQAPLAMVAIAAALAGCVAPAPSPGADQQGAAIAQAAVSPLADLNIVQAPIPPVLSEAMGAPYATPPDTACEVLASQLRALDAVLAVDLDTPMPGGESNPVERAAQLLGQAATDSVRGAAESVVPLRSWVRRLSGAERYSKEVAAAITAGTVRRAYLKGIAQARGCASPPAPRTAASAPQR